MKGEWFFAVCLCRVAYPDGLGECAKCRRVVVSTMRPHHYQRILAAIPEFANQRIGQLEKAS